MVPWAAGGTHPVSSPTAVPTPAAVRAPTAVLVGAGNRGALVYAEWAHRHPDRLRIVGVAEPDAGRRTAVAEAHRIPAEAVFADWRPCLEAPRRADVAIVATSDTLHVEPALAAVARGYDVLLEKPIAPTPADCVRVVTAAEAAGRLLQIGHVLRYTPFYEKVHEIVSGGGLGEVLHLDLREHVAAWHMAHSYVRGRFRNRAEAAPILLAKSCHDPDERLARLWPWVDVSPDPSREARRRALETGRYGRCVYHCDNDVLDHQTVALEFEGGVTASFALHGFAAHEQRTIRVTGTEGELRGLLDGGVIEVSRPGRLEAERHQVGQSVLGHYGGDEGLLDHFTRVVASGSRTDVRASGRSALESHLVGFAAERARETGTVVDVAAFRAEVEAGGPAAAVRAARPEAERSAR
jgi:predicted dehydrogenase